LQSGNALRTSLLACDQAIANVESESTNGKADRDGSK
jgi:hypothetical protein